jgi:hypothetical protein
MNISLLAIAVRLLTLAPIHHTQDLHRLLRLHDRPPFLSWPVLASSFTPKLGNWTGTGCGRRRVGAPEARRAGCQPLCGWRPA